MFEPDTQYSYTTYGYTLLGAAVEKASGMKLVDYFREKIFRPAGMQHIRDDNSLDVIPGRVRVSVDVRAPDRRRLDSLVTALELEPDFRLEPVPMAERPLAAFRDEIERRGLPVVELPSGAGHDAAILAAAGVPTAMLFVRSLNGGVSHSPEEESSPEDVQLAVDILTAALTALTQGAD